MLKVTNFFIWNILCRSSMLLFDDIYLYFIDMKATGKEWNSHHNEINHALVPYFGEYVVVDFLEKSSTGMKNPLPHYAQQFLCCLMSHKDKRTLHKKLHTRTDTYKPKPDMYL